MRIFEYITNLYIYICLSNYICEREKMERVTWNLEKGIVGQGAVWQMSVDVPLPSTSLSLG